MQDLFADLRLSEYKRIFNPRHTRKGGNIMKKQAANMISAGKQAGFTLIELGAALSIIAVLVAAASRF